MPLPILTIVSDALQRLNVYGSGASISAADGDLCLGVLNGIFDSWNAKRQAVWAEIFSTFALTPALAPHLIGPTGTWVLAVRPVTLDAASLIVTGVYRDIRIRDAAWWQAQPSPTLTGALPTDVYYEPDVPNGTAYFWPVPTTAYSVEIMTRKLLAQVLLTDSVTFPPGYRRAVTLTLIEEIAEPFGRTVSAKTEALAHGARADAFANNVTIPALDLQQGQGDNGGAAFNYLVGR